MRINRKKETINYIDHVIRGLNRKVTVDIKTIIPKPKVNETLIQNKIVEPLRIGDRFVLENIQKDYQQIIIVDIQLTFTNRA